MGATTATCLLGQEWEVFQGLRRFPDRGHLEPYFSHLENLSMNKKSEVLASVSV